LAEQEIYRLEVNVDISGDERTRRRLSAMDRYTERSERRMRQLDRMEASPAVRLEDRLSSPLNKVESRIGAFAKRAVKKFAAVATAGAVLLGGFGLGSTMQTFMDFEQGMKNVQATTMATEEEMVQLTDTAKKLGSTTAFTAKEASDGMNYLAMAGFKTNEIIEAMPGLLDLAAASGTDLARTSDIVSDALTAFGMTAQETTHLADVMAKASSSANTNVELLGESFKYAAAPATAFGMSAEETITALSKMADASIKGSMAGTALRGALTRLSKPPKQAAKWLDKLGISIADTEGNMRPFNDIMGDMRSSMKGLSQEQRQQAIASIFGQEAMSGMLAILNTSTEDFEEYTQSLKNADGAAKEMANMKMDSLGGQIEYLKSAIAGAKIELGEKLAPYAKDFVIWLTANIPNITDKIVELVDKTVEFGTKAYPYVVKFIDILKAISPLLAGIAAGFAAFKTGLIVLEVVKAFGKLKAIVGTVVFAFQAVAGGAATLAEGMALIMGPVGWVALAVGALVTGFVLAYKHSETFREKINSLGKGFMNFARPLIDFMIPILKDIGQSFVNLAQSVMPMVKDAFNVIGSVVGFLWQNILSPFLEFIIGVFVTQFKTSFSILGNAVITVVNTIAGVMKGLHMIFIGISDFIVGAFTGNWSQVWEGIKSISSGAVKVLSSIWTGLFGSLKELPGEMLDIGKDIMQGLADGIKSMITAPIEAAKDVAAGIAEKIRSKLKIHSPSRLMMEYGGFTTEGLAKGIKNKIPKLETVVGTTYKVITDKGENKKNLLKNFFDMTIPKAEKLKEVPFFQKVVEKTKKIKPYIMKSDSDEPQDNIPVVAAAGSGGGNTYIIKIDNIDVNIDGPESNGDSDEDIREIVQEAQEEFGRKLLEALRDKK